MTIGERLKEERERLGMTIPVFAEVAGAKKNTVIDWQKDVSSPPAAKLAALAVAGVDVQYVITGVRSSVAMSPDEEELLGRFRGASLEVKGVIIRALSGDTEGKTKSVTINAPGGHAAGRDMTIKKKS